MPSNDRQTQRFFVGGEQSPYLQARVDLARWRASLKECTNFVPIVQGCLTRRSGFADVYAAQANSRLIGFAFSASDGYAIEFAPSTGHCRFYRDYGILETTPGTPYELSNPYTAGEIAALSRAQTANWMYLACGTKPIYQMTRVAQTNWTLAAAAVKNGPFTDPNLDDTWVLSTPTATEITTGTTFTLASNKDLFQPGHVGSLWLLRERDGSQVGKWKGDASGFSDGNIVRWEQNTYKAVQHVNHTGDNPPVHLYGEEWDGESAARGFLWRYLHSGWGIAKVTAYTDHQNVTAIALSYIPAQLHNGGTWRWAEGAWSDVRGYPRLLCLHKKRLYWLGTAAQPTTGGASCIDDYTNFDAQTVDDAHAFVFDIEDDSGSGEVNIPQWMVSGKRLAIGTSGSEFVVGSSDLTSPISAASVDAESATNEGSAAIPAVKVDGPVFVSKDTKRIHAMAYDYSADDFVAPDLTIEAEHITGSGNVGVAGLAWQRDPYRLEWAWRTDGDFIAMTYRKDQNINGWSHQPTPKGKIKSSCVSPSPTGIRQDLWAIVERSLVAGTVRRIECLKPFFERGDLDVKNAFFVDGGFSRTFESPVTIVSNIPACYIGETFAILADGQVRPSAVVTAHGDGTGQILLDREATVVTCGLGFTSTAETLPYDRDAIAGNLAGRIVRVGSIILDLIRSAGLKVKAGNRDTELVIPSGSADVDSVAPLWSGPSADIGIDAGWDEGDTVTVTADTPLPATIRAISPNYQVAH